MVDILSLVGRTRKLFNDDVSANESEIARIVSASSFLVIGGAGSIGQAVVKQLFKRNPTRLHVVDISENNLVELVRDLRSSYGYTSGEFQTYAIDVGSAEFRALMGAVGRYDYVLNLSALKHVRSEKDPYTLMRMIDVNIMNTEATLRQAIEAGSGKYFCVSTDKAANPVNMMGASKRIMELFLMRASEQLPLSTARFANVAFSDGSLLHGFDLRMKKRQPIVAPNDVKRYFVTPEESGELCLLSCLFGENCDIFFPKLSEELDLISFADIATRYLRGMGMTPLLCEDEDEARTLAARHAGGNAWPCLFTKSDTTGEKEYEEFYTEGEVLDFQRFADIGIVKCQGGGDGANLDAFLNAIGAMRRRGAWTKDEILTLLKDTLPTFRHSETGRNLDGKM